MPPALVTSLLAGLVVTATVPGAAFGARTDPTPRWLPATEAPRSDPDQDELALERLRAATIVRQQRSYRGELTVIGFDDHGASIVEVDVTHGAGDLLVATDDGWEVGRTSQQGFLRSSSGLLQVGGVERLPDQLDRLLGKYAAAVGPAVRLDTGPAVPIRLTERATGTRREVLYLDEDTGLLVRRETFAPDGRPVRLVAFTSVDLASDPLVLPPLDGDVAGGSRHDAGPGRATSADGSAPVATLPTGYALLIATEVADASVPTRHLVYGDGLYTLSVFEQAGELSLAAVEGATELRTADGGAVWRFPGSEPRPMVWRGDGRTYTALSDAPRDEVLLALAGLPTDPPPSILDRLGRGLARVGRWLRP